MGKAVCDGKGLPFRPNRRDVLPPSLDLSVLLADNFRRFRGNEAGGTAEGFPEKNGGNRPTEVRKVTDHLYRNILLAAVVVTGVSSLVTQIAITREVINLSSGNEVVLGVVFSLWMFLTGGGAWLGRFVRSRGAAGRLFAPVLWGIAFLPFLQIVLLRLMKEIWFTRGVHPGLGDLIPATALVLLPYALLSGGILTLASLLLSKEEEGGKSLGRVYIADSVGDVFGGVLFTFALIPFFSNLHVLYVPALLCLAVLSFLPAGKKGIRWVPMLSVTAGIFLLVLIGSVSLDRASLTWLYPGQEILSYEESPYGRVVVARRHGQVTFFENGDTLFSLPDAFASEERVHFALAQVPKVKKVLLLSGGVSGALAEIEKYGVSRIDYVELDPVVLETGLSLLQEPLPDTVLVHLEDGRAFVEKSKERYDAVLMDLPDPASLQINRFYTVEFFREVRRLIAADGIFSFAVSGAENYISSDQGRFLSSLYNALEAAFGHVLVLPGEQNVFLASPGPLSTEVGRLLAEKGIQTVYVKEAWLSGRLSAERVSHIQEEIRGDVAPNRDFDPVAFRYRIRLWLAMFQERFLPAFLLTALGLAVYFFRLDRVGKVIFTTGFTAASLEIILLLSYQILHGSVYTGIGFLVAAFMLGLALGSFLSGRLPRVSLKTLLVLEGALLFFLFGYVLLIGEAAPWLGAGAFASLSVLLGGITGAEFPVAGRIVRDSPGRAAGSLYAADLFGGGMGALAAGLLLVPCLGVAQACLALFSLKGLLLLWLLVKR